MAMKRQTESKRRRRVKPQVGDLFAIDLADGRWGLGHLVASEGNGAATCYVLFAKCAASVDELPTLLDELMRKPIGVLVSNDTEIRHGTWPIVGQRLPDYPSLVFPQLSGVGSTWYTPGFLPNFIEAYNGLRLWDEGLGTPRMYRAILLPHLSVPPTARFRDPSTPTPPIPVAPPPPPITEGPAMLTIRIAFPGDGFPSTDVLHRRQDMERRLEAEGAGEVEGAESGAGVMEIFVRTDDVLRAVPIVEKIAGELGFAEDLLIETAPLEEDAEDGS